MDMPVAVDKIEAGGVDVPKSIVAAGFIAIPRWRSRSKSVSNIEDFTVLRIMGRVEQENR